MKILAIIQARMGSTRLPGKVLSDLAGKTMLSRVVNRVSRATLISDVIVATSLDAEDNQISELCESQGWRCFRGSELDVLDRYYRAAVSVQAEIIVRVTSDCPLIEPSVVDLVINEFLARQPELDYASNIFPARTFPRGLDTEVFRFEALERAWLNHDNPSWREHVTPYIYRNPEIFTLHGVTNDADYSSMRWTVDTQDDLDLVRLIYSHFGHDRFSWTEVIGLLEKHPDWLKINQGVEQMPIS